MKPRKIAFAFMLMAALSFLFLHSCKKKDKDDEPVTGCTDPNALNYNPNATVSDGSCQYAVQEDNNVTAASNSVKMTSEDVVIYNYSSYEGDNSTGKNAGLGDSVPLPPCAMVTVNPALPDTTFPKTVTIDFGTSGCVCKDGKTRKGKIIAFFSDRWKYRPVGDSIVITLQNYFVNDTMIKGARVFTLNSFTLSPKSLGIGFKTIDADIVYPNQDSVSWNANGTFVANLGPTISDYQDDVYKIHFNGNVKSVSGTLYTVQTKDTLVSELDCISQCGFIQGQLEATMMTTKDTVILSQDITVNIFTTVAVNFGTAGTCDDQLSYWTNVRMVNAGNSNEIYNQNSQPVTKTCSGFSK